jgi:hypothetical protein
VCEALACEVGELLVAISLPAAGWLHDLVNDVVEVLQASNIGSDAGARVVADLAV